MLEQAPTSLQFLLDPWVLMGFFGQPLFFMRFVVQWLASERKGRVMVPILTWYFSISGTLVLLTYSIYIKDPVFITAQVLSLFIYAPSMTGYLRLKAHIFA